MTSIFRCSECGVLLGDDRRICSVCGVRLCRSCGRYNLCKAHYNQMGSGGQDLAKEMVGVNIVVHITLAIILVILITLALNYPEKQTGYIIACIVMVILDIGWIFIHRKTMTRIFETYQRRL